MGLWGSNLISNNLEMIRVKRAIWLRSEELDFMNIKFKKYEAVSSSK